MTVSGVVGGSGLGSVPVANVAAVSNFHMAPMGAVRVRPDVQEPRQRHADDPHNANR